MSHRRRNSSTPTASPTASPTSIWKIVYHAASELASEESIFQGISSEFAAEAGDAQKEPPELEV